MLWLERVHGADTKAFAQKPQLAGRQLSLRIEQCVQAGAFLVRHRIAERRIERLARFDCDARELDATFLWETEAQGDERRAVELRLECTRDLRDRLTSE